MVMGTRAGMGTMTSRRRGLVSLCLSLEDLQSGQGVGNRLSFRRVILVIPA